MRYQQRDRRWHLWGAPLALAANKATPRNANGSSGTRSSLSEETPVNRVCMGRRRRVNRLSAATLASATRPFLASARVKNKQLGR